MKEQTNTQVEVQTDKVDKNPDEEGLKKAMVSLTTSAEAQDLVSMSSKDQKKIAQNLIDNKLAPASFKNAEEVFLAIHSLLSLGFKTFGQLYKGLTQCMVIRGVVRIWGDLPLGVVRQSGKLKGMREYFLDKNGKEISEENKNLYENPLCAVCEASRVDDPENVRKFYLTKQDLELSGGKMNDDGSWSFKSGKYGNESDTWKKYPKIMWIRRCRRQMINEMFPECFYSVVIGDYSDNQVIDITSHQSENKQIERDFKEDFKDEKGE